jgi:ABC-type polysaccharide/polyol phosphate transport system ATPase subunit
MKGKSLLELKNVGVQYRLKGGLLRNQRSRFWAIRGISLKLSQGDRLAVIGRNGAGKSTLLNVMAGIIAPDEGRLRCRSISRQQLSVNPGFDPVLTGEENAILSGMYLGRTHRQMERALHRIEALSELGVFFTQPISSYSSGMKSRLGLAVAMEAHPEILLLDEFLGTTGDAAFQQKAKSLLDEKMQRAIKAMVIVSHSPDSIKEYCNRAILIENGQLIASGTVQEVLDRYATVIVTPGRNTSLAPAAPPSKPVGKWWRLLKGVIRP